MIGEKNFQPPVEPTDIESTEDKKEEKIESKEEDIMPSQEVYPQEEKKEKGTEEILSDNKEIEKLPPIYLIYRDNDLFKKWTPKIRKILKEGMNRKVETHSFPAGTESEDIEMWIKENENKICSKDVVTDGTIANLLPREIEKKMEHNKHLYALDSVLDRAVKKIVLKNMAEKKLYDIEEDFKDTREAFCNIVEQIIENEDKKPKKVCIIANKHLVSHAPLGGEEVCPEEEREKLPAVKIFKKWIETKNPSILDSLKRRLIELEVDNVDIIIKNTRDLEESLFERWQEAFIENEMAVPAAKIIKEWLIEAGILEQDIEISQEKYRNEDDKKGNWIIADRHNYPLPRDPDKLPPKNAIDLQLPLSDFFKTATEAGLINVDPVKLEQEIEKELRKRIDEEKEELD